MKVFYSLFFFLIITLSSLSAQSYKYIFIKKDAHPAIKSAAKIIAEKFHISSSHIKEEVKLDNPKSGEIVLDCGNPSESEVQFIGQNPTDIKFDGYLIKFGNGGAMIFGKRPRSLLYAAGDFQWWKNKQGGIYLRQPDFKVRDINLGSTNNVTQLIVNTGANIVFQNIIIYTNNFLQLIIKLIHPIRHR